MDWSNEHYVRIYTRDTTTWRLLGWDGQSVLMQVLRRLDQSGVLEIDDVAPWEAVMIHCGAPEEVARAGMRSCLDRGVLLHNGRFLIAPKFQEAQEASKSDKQRQKESRDRRRTTALLTPDPPVTKRDKESQNGTPSSRNGTQTSQPVTSGHTPSQAVTLCSSSALPIPLPLPVPCSDVTSAAAAAGLVVDPVVRLASAGRTWFRETAKLEDPDHRGRYEYAYSQIAQRPVAEMAIAATTLAREGQSGRVRRMLTPTHVLDFWGTYARGEVPGRKGLSAVRGPSPVASADEYAAAAAQQEEDLPWNVSQK
jgi:hypothetical protein